MGNGLMRPMMHIVSGEADSRADDEDDDASPPMRPTTELTMRPEVDLANEANDVSCPMRPTAELTVRPEAIWPMRPMTYRVQ